MTFYILLFVVSSLIGILLLMIKIKEDVKKIVSSYSNSSKLMLNLNKDEDLQQDAIFKELKIQFTLLLTLLVKFLLIITPLILLILYMWYVGKSLSSLFDLPAALISLAALALVYSYKLYAKSK
jgi:ABC-type multidrug transport system permease subunit